MSPNRDMPARILDTAVELFLSRGYADTSLREIAEGLGVTKAAIYYHYRTKGELLEALFEPFLAEMERVIAEAGDVTQVAQLRAFVDRYVDALADHAPVVSLLARDVSVRTHPPIGERAQRLQQAQLGLLGRGRDDPAARLRAAAALGLVGGVAIYGDFALGKVRDELIELVNRVIE